MSATGRLTAPQLELLEHMPVKPEYREAFRCALEILRGPIVCKQSTPQAPPVSEVRAEIQRLRQQHAHDLELINLRHKEVVQYLRAELEDLRELVHPPGTWQAERNPRRLRLKSLYCSWLNRWRYYDEQVREFARDERGHRVFELPDDKQKTGVERSARALFDAAICVVEELDALEKTNVAERGAVDETP